MTSLDVVGGAIIGATPFGAAAKIATGGLFKQAFQSVLNIPSTSIAGTYPSVSAPSNRDEANAGPSITAAPSKLQTALADFLKEARKTPAERAHDQILAKHHLSEDDYKALSPDDKKAIDQEIVARTRLLMKNSAGTGTAPSEATVA